VSTNGGDDGDGGKDGDAVRAANGGGTPPGAAEVACDESGSDGENLTTGNTDVFAHASVRMPLAEAAAYVQEVRDRIRSPAEEYKATHLLREKHRAVLEWFLSPGGPLHGRAHVDLTEKAFFVVERAVTLLLGGAADAAAPFRAGPEVLDAAALFRAGAEVFGESAWRRFLAASNGLLRGRNAGDPAAPVENFFHALGALDRTRAGAEAADVLARLAAARPRAGAVRSGLVLAPRTAVPVLNPRVRALMSTAAHWSADGRAVRLVHDEQNVLTPDRVARIVYEARRAGIPLAGLRLVDSRRDARVQLADFLAGIARKLASDELNGRGEAALTALLRPYVGPDSVWGDRRSWHRLGPVATGPGAAREALPGHRAGSGTAPVRAQHP
jgi:hypothetical protein